MTGAAVQWMRDGLGIIGIARGTTRAHLARAALEAIAYQTRDVVDLMCDASGTPLRELRVDGGAAVVDLLLELQADQLGVAVVRATTNESTALGAAFAAGIGAGVCNTGDIAANWSADRRFETPGPSGAPKPIEHMRSGCGRWNGLAAGSREP